MATSLPAQSQGSDLARVQVRLGETAVRLAGASIIGLALAAFVVGTAWDTQWHVAVGRDRALTAPHVMMLAGIAIVGLMSLLLVVLDTWRARRGGLVAAHNSSRVLGFFQAPAGIVLAGVGALLAAVAFPLDDYWHSLYGIDVTLWAPFHVMIVSGMVTSGLGVLFMLATEARQATSPRQRMLLELASAMLLAITWSVLLLLLPQANADDGLTALGSYQLVWYPILLAAALPLITVVAQRLTHLPAPATLVALLTLLIRQIMFWFVPWAVEATRLADGLVYRPNPPVDVITPYALPLSILFVAIALDLAVWLFRRSNRRAPVVALVAVAATLLAAFVERPWSVQLTGNYFPTLDTQQVLLQTMPFALLGALAGLGLALVLNRSFAVARH
jgi:hypothetical protein